MGTRYDIIVQKSDGTWARIYCHWDGYLEHNGKILFEHYTSQAQVEKLIALGDLSVLGPRVGSKHPFDGPSAYLPGGDKLVSNPAYEAYQKKYGGMCKAYMRDRGEDGCEPRTGATLAEVWPEQGCWTEFTYVWTEGKWWVGDPDEGSQTLIDLGDALTGKEILTPKVKAFGATIGQHVAHDPANPDLHKWKGSKT